MNKNPVFIFFCFLFLLGTKVFAQQIHYVEDFSLPNPNPSLTNLANGYNGWTVTSTGANGAEANEWFVSCEENGNTVGQCGSACAGDQTLHLGCTFPLNDLGASYYAGGFGGNPQTHKRAESPTINCSCSGNVVYLDFKYIAGGDATDYFSLYYYDGLTWTLIVNPATTFSLPCAPQGQWTQFPTVSLPLSAVNNPNVKIGFNWQNDNNLAGTDPSAAIDSIVVWSYAATLFADFTYSPGSPCIGDAVDFTNTSVPSGTTWSWNFSATATPTTSTLQNPTGVQFSGAGLNLVTLEVTDGCGDTSTAAQFVIVGNCVGLNAAFTSNATQICEGDSIQFTDNSTGNPSATSYEWLFPGGIPSTFLGAAGNANPPPITYSTAGSYDVTLIIANGFSNDTLVMPGYVTVLNCQLPTAFFSASDTTLCGGDCITYTDASIPAANITGWNWNFPGGTPGTFIGQNPPQICYNTPGVYDAELTVDDGINFNTLTFTGYITVTNCTPPTAAFTVSLPAICATQCVTYTNQSLLATTWTWSFPGGSPSSFIGQNPPQICYATSGSYDAQLIVSNANGIDTLLISNIITVSSCIPTAAFSAAVTSGCNGDCFNFTNQSTGATSWTWQFPGGNPSAYSGQNPPQVCYINPGVYDVSLLVSNAYGADSVLQTGYITIVYCNNLFANFAASDTFICAGDCISFVDLSTGAPIGWSWDLPGGVPDTVTAQNPPFVCYPNSGVFPVTLYVFNVGGGDTLVKSGYITVNDGTPVSTNIDTTTIFAGQTVQLTASGGVSYLWYPESNLNGGASTSSPIASPVDTTNYTVTMTDANGCSSTGSILVNVIPPETVWAPTAFTPNNDNMNDIFYVKSSGIITDYELRIFDRWGELLFKTNESGQGWDGTYHNVKLNVGVYIYYYKIVYIDETVLENSGDVTLLR